MNRGDLAFLCQRSPMWSAFLDKDVIHARLCRFCSACIIEYEAHKRRARMRLGPDFQDAAEPALAAMQSYGASALSLHELANARIASLEERL